MKNKIILFILFVLGLSTIVALKANNKKEYTPFYVGECSLAIPYGYGQGVNSDGIAMFSPSLKSGFQDMNIYQVHWEKNASLDLEEKFKKAKMKIINIQEYGHLKLVKSLDEYNNESLWLIGKTFHMSLYELNKHSQALIKMCNQTWDDTPLKLDRDVLEENLKNDFDISQKEIDIIIEQILKVSQ